VEFYWDRRDGVKVSGKHAGFIAQEVQEVDTWLGLVYDDNPEKLEVTAGKLLPVAIKAIQELSALVTALTERVAILEGN
jgi:hypothetical protein